MELIVSTETVIAFLERVCTRAYQDIKRLYLRARFDGRIFFGKNVNFRTPFFCRVGPSGRIVIGKNTFLNYGVKIIAHESITIGSGCLFGPNAGIYDFDHIHELDGTPYGAQGMSTEAVVIGNNVWIGANSVILKESVIGDNAVIAADTVVSGEVPPDSLVFDHKERVTRIRK